MNYILDLAAGLTQVLADGTNTYLYGNGRIAQQTLTTEYFLTDALGSVRQLADSTGALTLTQSYAPYGETVSSAGGGYSRFQFTGEARDANGLTYLRARYYDPSDGRFISRDTWGGDYNRPLSLNRWNYTEGNPVNLVDPSGRFPEYCHNMPTRMEYEDCAREFYGVSRPQEYSLKVFREDGTVIDDEPGCHYDAYPIPYNGIGYIEGYNKFFFTETTGVEIAYDFTTMTSAIFDYDGKAYGDSTLGAGYSQYAGIVGFWPFPGFNSQKDIFKDYDGAFVSASGDFALEIGLGFNTGVTGFVSPTWNPIGGIAWNVGWGASWDPVLGYDVVVSGVDYVERRSSLRDNYVYTDKAGFQRVNWGILGQEILAGQRSPWSADVIGQAQLSRLYVISKLPTWARIYEGLHNAGK